MVRNTDKDVAEVVGSPQEAVTASATPARRRRKVTAAQSEPGQAADQGTKVPEEREARAHVLAVDLAAEPGGTGAAAGKSLAPEPQQPVRRGRRKAVAQQASAVAETAGPETDAATEAPAAPAPEALEASSEPAPKRRRRKAEAVAAEPPVVETPAAEATDSPAPKRRRRKAEATTPVEASVAEAPDTGAVAEPAAPASEPDGSAPRRRRRKVVAAQSAPAPAPAPEAASAEAASAPQEAVEAEASEEAPRLPAASLLFQAPDPVRAKRRRRKATAAAQAPQAAPAAEPQQAVDPEPAEAEEAEAVGDGEEQERSARKRRRGGRGRRSRSRAEAAGTSVPVQDAAAEGAPESEPGEDDKDLEASESSSRRRRRRRSRSRAERAESRDARDEIAAPKGSTRLEAKRQRRREGRAAGRRRPIVTEAEFLARRESVERQMIVREQGGLNQIAVLEDGLLVEHYVARHTQTSMVGNVYVGRVQNVLPSMEAAFVDLGKGRNAVLYAGEVNWDAAGMEGSPRRIEDALSSGDTVLVQVTKDPIGHKGARLTSQITLAGRYLVLVPGGSMTGISRKLPDTERARLKKVLKKVVPDDAGVIVRTAAEGASEEQLAADVERLLKQWAAIDKKAKQVLSGSGRAPVLLKGEPELAVRVVRDVFNEDFKQLIVSGRDAWATISKYVTELSPDLADRLVHWVEPQDVFAAHRVDEQLAKGFDRKVWLPSGGTLVIDRTEAMTVIDVNTGRFTGGAGGTLEETVTRNNLEAAEEIVRQLRLRDIGGMVVIDFVDMVLEANRDLVLRRLVECLGRDRTRHQVTEVTSLGLVQMTRKRVGQGLVEAFSTQCDCCGGRGFVVHDDPVENQPVDMSASASRGSGRGRRSKKEAASGARERDTDKTKAAEPAESADEASREVARNALAQIAAAAEQAHRD